MSLFAHKFVACVVLLAVLVANADCFCAESEKESTVAADANPSDRCGDEHGDHDQDHHHHESCECRTNFVYMTDNAVSLHSKLARVPPLLVFFDPHWVHHLVSVSQAIRSGFNAH